MSQMLQQVLMAYHTPLFDLGYNGVFKCGQQLKCEIINNNLLKIYDGLFINQGRFYRIAPVLMKK